MSPEFFPRGVGGGIGKFAYKLTLKLFNVIFINFLFIDRVKGKVVPVLN
jgi:hypothetical protein